MLGSMAMQQADQHQCNFLDVQNSQAPAHLPQEHKGGRQQDGALADSKPQRPRLPLQAAQQLLCRLHVHTSLHKPLQHIHQHIPQDTTLAARGDSIELLLD